LVNRKIKLIILGILLAAILTASSYYYYNNYLPSIHLKIPTTIFKSTGKADKFGILEVYPTKPRGREWFIDMNNPTSDGIFNPQSNITRQSDGSWQISGRPNIGKYNNEVRMEVNTLNGQQEWKDVEITGYAKVISANPPFDSLVWYARGGRHDAQVPCEGTSLKGRLTVNGAASWIKEIWHTGGYTNERAKIQATNSIIGRWVGWKVVMYNIDNGKAVKMESYLDDNANNKWVKVTDIVDSGGWYSNRPDAVFYSANCGKPKDYVITNGGLIATFRSDNMVWDFKALSVREIQGPT
jgi:hypothetical protein